MASSDPVLGTVMNMNDVSDKKSGPVAVSITLGVGLVYEDGVNGWKQAPTDGTIHADELYWNPTSLTSTATLGGVTGTFYGEGAKVIGKADGAIVVDNKVKASTTSSHGGQLISLADPANATTGATYGGGTATKAAIDAIRDWQRNKIAIYKGHANEVNNVGAVATDAVDEDINCVFQVTRG